MAVSTYLWTEVAVMSDAPNKSNINTPLFNNPSRAILTSGEREALRTQLVNDVEAWLAKGNQIDDRGQTVDNRNDRRVRFHIQGQFN